MKNFTAFSILLLSSLTLFCQNFIQLQKITASDRKPGDWYHRNSISGDYMVVGASSNSFNAIGTDSAYQAGAVYVYKKNANGNWVEIQKLIAPDRKAGDWFGYSVAISGNYIVVGAHKQDWDENNITSMPDAGAAYVYEKNGSGTWVFKQKIVAPDRHNSAWFATWVSISGDVMALSCNNQCTDVNNGNWLNAAGAAYMYRKNAGGNWLFEQKIVAPDRMADDYFGNSICVNGNFLAVGATGNDLDENGSNYLKQAGAAYVFESNSSNQWNFVQKLVAFDRDTMDWFGHSQIAIDSQRVVVGAHWQDKDENGNGHLNDAGAAYVYKRNTTGTYTLEQKLIPSLRFGAENFGNGVALYKNFICIGSSLNDLDSVDQNTVINAGAAYVFRFQSMNNKWIQYDKITAKIRNGFSLFGMAISMDSSQIIVGAPWEKYDFNEQNYYASTAGAVYTFKLVYPVSVEEIENNEVMIYPNPFSDKLNLEFETQPIRINITNIEGKQILNQTDFISNRFELNTNEWENGLYLIQIIYQDTIISKKIVHLSH